MDAVFGQDVVGLPFARDKSDEEVFAPDIVVTELGDCFQCGSAREPSRHREPPKEGVRGLDVGSTRFVRPACSGRLRKRIDVNALRSQQTHREVLTIVEQAA